jgi:hypothetical protein
MVHVSESIVQYHSQLKEQCCIERVAIGCLAALALHHFAPSDDDRQERQTMKVERGLR